MTLDCHARQFCLKSSDKYLPLVERKRQHVQANLSFPQSEFNAITETASRRQVALNLHISEFSDSVIEFVS